MGSPSEEHVIIAISALARSFKPDLDASRMTVWLAAAILSLNLLVATTIVTALYRSHQQQQEQVVVTAQNLAGLLTHDIAATFDRIDLALLSVMDEANRQRGKGNWDATTLNDFIARQENRLPELSDLHIADAQGNLRYGTGLRPDSVVNIADREHFIRQRDHSDTGLFVSKPIVSRMNGKWQLALTRRLNQGDGSFAGVVTGLVELDMVTRMFATLDIGKQGIVVLRDQGMATVVRHPAPVNDKSPIDGTAISSAFMKQIQTAPEAGVFQISPHDDDIERTFAYRKISNYPFYIFVGLAADDHFEVWRKDVATNGFLMAIFTLVSLGFLWMTIRIWQRREADLKVIQQQEIKFRTLLDALPDALVIVDANGRIVMLNQKAETLFGYKPEELLGQPVEKLLPQRYRDGHTALRQDFTRTPKQREMRRNEPFWTLSKQGLEIPVDIGLSPIQTAQGLMMAAVLHDSTLRMAHEAKIRRLTGLYVALNQYRQAIVRCTSEDELFQAICRAAVQFGDMKMAWIGLVDAENQLVKPVACYGANTEYLDDIHISVNADDPAGRGSTGTSIRENRPVWNQDFQNDPRLTPWHVRGAGAGWRSSAALPLQRQGKPVGALNLYAGEINAFDETTCNLLMEMARDIGHALDTYSLQAAQKQAGQELRIAAAAFDSQQGMMITDANSVILRINTAFTEITGYTSEETVGNTPRMLQSGRHDADFYREMWATIDRTGGWQGEIWDRRKNGEIYPKWLTISAVKNEQGVVTHYVGAHHDITERKKAEEKIHELAFFDQLTGLPNRTLLLDRLKQIMAVSSRSGSYGALMFIDLDHFKTLNDTMGHEMGDLLLKQVAQRLMHSVREGDSVARLGGDEFVVILAGLSSVEENAASSVETVAGKILAALNQPYQIGTLLHKSSASIGITLFNGDTSTVDNLMKQADLAMYMSKAAGRDAIRFFNPSLESALKERAALEHDLRLALIDEQFLLHYQAQIEGDGHLTGAEALLRWQHPQHGMMSPADFIPLAEETGLILPLGRWVLQTACTQLAAWASRPEMAHLSVAVNVSVHQFRQNDFVNEVLTIIEQTGANPKRLKLEMTESLLVSNIEDIIGKMTALKTRGVGFSLDDFGTGYSSLSYLKRMPLDQLKIDQGFVRDILIDANDAAIAKTIIALARSLGLDVIAEGVETAAQRDFLTSSGCHAYQGYFFSRPLPLDLFEKYALGARHKQDRPQH